MEIGETFPPYWPQNKQYAHDYASRYIYQKVVSFTAKTVLLYGIYDFP